MVDERCSVFVFYMLVVGYLLHLVYFVVMLFAVVFCFVVVLTFPELYRLVVGEVMLVFRGLWELVFLLYDLKLYLIGSVRYLFVLFIGCVSYRILRYLPNLYKCLGTCSFNFTHWYIRVPVVKYLFLCLIPG